MSIEMLEELLTKIAKQGISEYHMTPGTQPFHRINGVIDRVEEAEVVNLVYMKALADLVLSDDDQEKLMRDGSHEIAYPIQNVGRFRLRFGKQRSSITLVILVKSTKIPSAKELKIPEDVVSAMHKSSGLLIVCSEIKSTKAKTIASLLSEAANASSKIITTIENPIDYLIPHGKGIVNQMEVGVDINSIGRGLNEAVNNHSDIIYVNDVHKREEWEQVFNALEKGFFVIVSMNSNGVEAAINRLLYNFNQDEQTYIKRQMANFLIGLVYEINLLTKENETQSIYEVLLNNQAVHNMLIENKLSQLPEIFKAFPNSGIINIDTAIAKAVSSGEVDREHALSRARNQSDLMKVLNGINK